MNPTFEASDNVPIRILLVDNDPDHARAMAESLERVGYTLSLIHI